MARPVTPVTHRLVLALLLVSAGLSALTYPEEPDTVLELSQGSGNYQVDMKAGEGPYRLIATRSRIYLLDQLNNRVLCYTRTGSFLEKIKTSFSPADMAVDRAGKIYLLDNRSQSAQVAVIDDGSQVDLFSIRCEPDLVLTGLVIHPEQGLVVLSGNNTYRAVLTGGFLQCAPSKTYRLKELESLTLEDALIMEAREFASFCVPLDCEGRNCYNLLAYDDAHVWVGSETWIQDKSGSFAMRDVGVYRNGKMVWMVPVDENYFSKDVGWRNVSVDSQGNVYVFTSTPEGKASILRWRPSP